MEAATSVFSDTFQDVLQNLSTVQLETTPKEDLPCFPERSTGTESSLSCSYCRVNFPDLQSQRLHFKLDWHRYNLKQSLGGRSSVTEEEFDERNVNDDVSSISGSDSEKEDTLDTYATAQGKVFLRNDKKTVFSIYRCLLCDRKEDLSDLPLTDRLKTVSVDNAQWTVLMLGGGHFAGGVFRGSEPLLHKTFHCYTVRAGQGGAQSQRDSKSGGSHPKSAGASLRRYNEQSLVQHVRSIIETWKPEIDRSSLIIYRASGPVNRSVLFSGNPAPLDRSDARLRTVPFSTRRATFTELKRVHGLLSTAKLYNSLEHASENFSKQHKSSPERSKVRSTCINRAKSREINERPLPTETVSSGGSSDIENIALVAEDLELSTDGLKQHDLSPEAKSRRKKKKPKKSKTKREEERKKELVDLIARGDVNGLRLVADRSEQDKVQFFNCIVDDSLNTLLHCAAMNEQEEMVVFLLKHDANPCVKNKNQDTPYSCTQSRNIREALRQFARENPEKYNYNKAHIPTNALTIEELADKKRAQRKVKREKEKTKRKENDIKKKEEEAKDGFLQLSDREKRTMTSERKVLDQSGNVIVRCFQCATDMTGKVPFEYSNNVFCCIGCLKAHRAQNPSIVS